MAPTIVYGANGKPVLAVGAAGGSTIPAQVIKTIIGFLDFKLTPQQAVALPMIYAPADTLFVESGTAVEAMTPQLKALGHADIKTQPSGTFKTNAIGWVDGRPSGGADPRSEGAVVSQ
jgi:gamma-glutamyltranspeptidase/glutathione hydrolase